MTALQARGFPEPAELVRDMREERDGQLAALCEEMQADCVAELPFKE